MNERDSEKTFKEKYRAFKRGARKVGRNLTMTYYITKWSLIGGAVGYAGYHVYDTYKALDNYLKKIEYGEKYVEYKGKKIINNIKDFFKGEDTPEEKAPEKPPKRKKENPLPWAVGSTGIGLLTGYGKGRRRTKYSRMKEEHEKMIDDNKIKEKEYEEMKMITWKYAQTLSEIYDQLGKIEGIKNDPEYLKIGEKVQESLKATEKNNGKSLEKKVENYLIPIGILGLITIFAISIKNMTGFFAYNLSKTNTFYFEGILFILLLLIIFLEEEFNKKRK